MAGSGYAITAIKKEIEKCEIRCKNCHALITYKRAGNVWHTFYLNDGKIVAC